MKTKLKYALPVIIPFLLFLNISMKVHGQEEKALFEEMMRQDSADVNILALYPDKVREHIFEVATQPEIVMCLGDLRKKTNEDFKQLVSSYTKDEQQEIWNLTRYEGLIDQLVKGEKKSTEETEDILKDYPAEVHDAGLHYSRKHYELLVNVDKINKNFEHSFEDLVAELPTKTRFAFIDLMKEPEAISILSRNMAMTVRIGNIYKRNPGLVVQEFNSLNLELARQKAKDAEEWKEELKNNPEAAEELKKSAKEYAEENGYNENEYRETDPQVIEHYNFYPYPFWCGYPWWYGYDYWYPYPYWYHWGFYWWHNDFFWYGAPSWYFMDWHFHHYNCFYDYPHLTNTYINYYYGHRRGTGSNTLVVHRWVKENEKSLPRDFISNKGERMARIKEYGKFQIDYVNHVMSTPKPIKRSDFLEQHQGDYPHLQPVKGEVHPKGTVPVKHPQDIKGNQVKPGTVIHPHDQYNPVKPKTNPVTPAKPGIQQQQQPRPQMKQPKPATIPNQPKSSGK